MAAAGDRAGAVDVLRRLAAGRPRAADVHALLGRLLMNLGRHEEAVAPLEHAGALKPRDVEVRRDLGVVLQSLGRLDEAEAVLEDARRTAPSHPGVIATIAELHGFRGDFDSAAALLTEIVDAGGDDWMCAAAYARISPKIGRVDHAVEVLERHLAEGERPPGERRIMLFRLAHLFEVRGEYERAWDAAAEANGLRGVSFDAMAFRAVVDRMLTTWTREAVEAMRGWGEGSDRPVFIVGMPRSGTSVIEQAAASHPEVYGAGELAEIHSAAVRLGGPRTPLGLVSNPGLLGVAGVAEEAGRFLRRLEELGGGAARVTDKQPVNTLHLGLIAAMLPRARVVHVRRDPVDACVSCFMNDFVGMPFTFEIGGLASFYAGQARLMAHWGEVLDLAVLEVEYEQFVSDAEAAARRLIEFLDLPWDDACARPHEADRVVTTVSNLQVREPVHTRAVGRWRRFGAKAEPLRAALAAEGVEGAGA